MALSDPYTTAIVLVDSALLRQLQDKCNIQSSITSVPKEESVTHFRDTSNDTLTTITESANDYTGHFIYLLGCILTREGDTEHVIFHYLDPAKPQYDTTGLLRTRTVDSTTLDQARRHPGTDEDIIFIRFSN